MNNKVMAAIKLLVSLGLIITFLNYVDLDQAKVALLRVTNQSFLYIFICLLLCTLVTSLRWQKILEQRDLPKPPTLTKLIIYTYIGSFFNQVLPSSIGGDVYRALALKHRGFTMGQASSILLADRVFGLIATGLIFFIAAVFIEKLPDSNLLNIATWSTSFVCTFGVVIFIFIIKRLGDSFKSLKFIKRIADQITISTKKSGPSIIFYSLLNMTTYILPFYFILNDTGVVISLAQVFYIAPMVVVLTSLPISFAGWGVREGAFAFSLVALGFTAQSAITASLIFGLTQIIVALPGVIFFTLEQSHKKKFSD